MALGAVNLGGIECCFVVRMSAKPDVGIWVAVPLSKQRASGESLWDITSAWEGWRFAGMARTPGRMRSISGVNVGQSRDQRPETRGTQSNPASASLPFLSPKVLNHPLDLVSEWPLTILCIFYGSNHIAELFTLSARRPRKMSAETADQTADLSKVDSAISGLSSSPTEEKKLGHRRTSSSVAGVYNINDLGEAKVRSLGLLCGWCSHHSVADAIAEADRKPEKEGKELEIAKETQKLNWYVNLVGWILGRRRIYHCQKL